MAGDKGDGGAGEYGLSEKVVAEEAEAGEFWPPHPKNVLSFVPPGERGDGL